MLEHEHEGKTYKVNRYGVALEGDGSYRFPSLETQEAIVPLADVAAQEAYAAGLGASEWPAFQRVVPWAKAFPRPELETA